MNLFARILFTGMAGLSAAVGSAQETPYRLEDETITAEKRDGNSQTAALSVTAIPGDELTDAGYDRLADAAILIPNLHVSQFNVSRLTFPTIRGVGSGQGNPAVLTYIDDVPQLTYNTVGVPLVDLQRLEVLRGPQGTLYGRNALGGVIHVVTREPGDVFSGRARVGLGSDGLAEGTLSLSGPFSDNDTLFWGLTLAGRERDGYVTNVMTGNRLDPHENVYARLKLAWRPSDDWDATLTLVRERSNDGSFALSELNALRANPYQMAYDYEGAAEREIIGPSLRLRHRSDNLTFTSVTAFQASQISESTDVDFSPADFNRRHVAEDQDQFWQEFRLNSNEGSEIALSDDVALAWLVGAAGWYGRVDNASQTEIRQGYVDFFPADMITFPIETNDAIDQTDKGIALFGEGTFLLGDAWELTLGSRIAHERKEADVFNNTTASGFPLPGTASSVSPKESYTEFLPKAALAFFANENLTLYGHVERGFKSGGFNQDQNTPAGKRIYDTETSWSYELGAKWRSADGRAWLRAAVYWIDWNDMQLTQPIGGGLFYVDNVGEAQSRGFELEASLQVCEKLRVFGSVGVADTEFQRYNDPYAGDVSGNELNNVPATTWLAGAEWRSAYNDWNFYLRADVSGTGELWYDPGNTQKDNGWVTTNLRGGVKRGRLGFEAWLRNAFDETYVPIALQIQPGYFVGQPGAPQEAGVAVTVEF